jgi:hypothetical protein
MGLHRFDSARPIVIGDGVDHGGVLRDHAIHSSGQRQRQQAEAVNRGLLAEYHAPQRRVSRDIGDRRMELLVRFMEDERVRLGAPLLAQDAPELGDLAACSVRRRLADPHAFERLTDHHGFADGVEIDTRDIGAALRADVDEVLVGETQQRLANRGPADAELLGELLLDERDAGLQVDGDDAPAQLGVDAA